MIAAKIRKPTRLEKQAYDAITGGKRHYGVYHKSCFHLHTPVSHDYKLLESWDAKQYKEATAEELLALSIERRVVMPMVTLEDIRLEDDFGCFETKKQALSFLLLADSIMLSKIEIVLVADHNTICGVDKLEAAIKWVYETKKYCVYPTVILGVEISCADRNHVVGMFSNTTANQAAIKKWIRDHIIDEEDGVFVTSIEALDFIHNIGGIGYIAHINTSDILKSGTFSGGFKKMLFDSHSLKYVGVSDVDAIDRTIIGLKQYRKAPVKFLLDNDAHDLDAVAKNCFWIKGGKCAYSMVAEALNDYNISVEFMLPASAKQYIKGLYVERSDDSFLQSKEAKNFCITFSNALNCLIGGRGTGKSSVLEMLEYVLSQRCGNERMLAFLCKHGTAWVVYDLDGEEFLFEISMPKSKYRNGNILECFGGAQRIDYKYRYVFKKKDVSYHAATHYLHISKIVHEENGWHIESIDHPERIRDKFLDSKYSINELVNTASGEEINQFIQDTILKNVALTELPYIATFRRKGGLVKMLATIETKLQQREVDIENILQPFNSRMSNVLNVSYKQNPAIISPDFERLLFNEHREKRGWYKKRNIREKDIIAYLLQLYDKLGAISFFRVLAENDIEVAQTTIGIRHYLTNMTLGMVEMGIQSIEVKDEAALVGEIFGAVMKESNMSVIRDFFQEYLLSSEQFALAFNVNNREGSPGQARFQDVRDLSLGQKVVAMLTFVLGYSEYSGDFRPLIIDQPEDNLDNQYIYKNLVAQLRAIKEKRQVIIATHNATIVTNAKADLVCEMQSDHSHGWIETMGYPSEERIKKKILNHLEGGIDSFVHKIDIYRNVISR